MNDHALVPMQFPMYIQMQHGGRLPRISVSFLAAPHRHMHLDMEMNGISYALALTNYA